MIKHTFLLLMISAACSAQSPTLVASYCAFYGDNFEKHCPFASEVGQDAGPELTFYVRIDGGVFTNAALVSFEPPSVSDWSRRDFTLIDSTHLTVTLLPTDIATIGKGSLKVTDGSLAPTAQFAVYPPCHSVLGDNTASVTNAVGAVVPARSNGRDFGSGFYSCGDETTSLHLPIASNYGSAFQCPEFVRRYYAGLVDSQHDPSTEAWRGNALSYHDKAKAQARGLVLYENASDTAPQIGDIIVFQKPDVWDDVKKVWRVVDNTGHVAIITNTSDSSITVIEQNFSPKGTRSIPYDRQTNTVQIDSEFKTLGWLRSAAAGGGSPPLTTGTIAVVATHDNIPSWHGPVNCQLSGAAGFSLSQVPASIPSMPQGVYTVTCLSGGPPASGLLRITPNPQQQLNGGGGITFSLDFYTDECTVAQTSKSGRAARETALAFAAQSACPAPVVSPLFISCSCTPNPVATSQTTICAASVSGGAGPFHYAWSSGGTIIGSSSGVAVEFPSTGGYAVTLSVTDSGTPASQTRATSCPVEVTLAPTLAGLCSISPNPITLGQGATVIASGSGGSAPYQFQMGPGLPFSSVNTIGVLPPAAGTFTYSSVTVKDSLGQTAPASCSAQVNPSPTLTAFCSVNGSSTPITVDAGTQLNYAVTVSGGNSPYHFVWSGVSGAPDSSTISVTPSGLASLDVSALVKDSSSPITSTTAACPRVTINPALTGSCSISPNPITLGQGATVTASGSGGSQPYQYQMTSGGSFSSVNSIGVLPQSAGTFTYSSVTVKDSLGQTAPASCSAQVNPPPALTASCYISPNPINLGDGTTVFASASGGTGGYTYSINGSAYQSGSTSTIQPLDAGTATANVSVKDSSGSTAQNHCSVTVRGGPPTVTGVTWFSTPHNRVNFSGSISGTKFVPSSTVWFCVSGTNTCYQQPSAGVLVQGLGVIQVTNVNLTTGSWQVEVITPYGSAKSSAFSVLP